MSLEPFVSFASRAVPLMIDNIDTDVITPIGRVLQGPKATVEFAFEPLRFAADGTLDPACPLNDPAYAGARILIAGDNFACGSSRETAVWAVKGLGYAAVIAAGFGGIFFSNCFKNGVLPIVLAADAVAALAEFARGGGEVSVDLEAQRVTGGPVSASFEISPLRKEALLGGLDDLGVILKRAGALEAFEARDRAARPWVYLT
jgi:3-isopropylmalate/(R)-2-methylmalate dehydratase small subunit